MKIRSLDLGLSLRCHRLAADMRLIDVAEAMEVSAATISRWENGQSDLTIIQLRALAAVLGIERYWNLLR